MSLALMYYLITLVGAVACVLSSLFWISILISICLCVGGFVAKEDCDKEAAASRWKGAKNLFGLGMVILVLSVFIPSKKDATIIAGLSLGEKGVTKVVEEAGEFYPMLKKVLKKELTELAEDKEE